MSKEDKIKNPPKEKVLTAEGWKRRFLTHSGEGQTIKEKKGAKPKTA